MLSVRIIPAYAGQLCAERSRVGAFSDHPRIRGATGLRHGTTPCSRGSSPHTRGNCRAVSSPLACRRIIPAYAGQLAGMSSVIGYLSDHPRIRGATIRGALAGLQTDGSSPHTRGNFPLRGLENFVERIIPAYAGQLMSRCNNGPAYPDHPRIRGATRSR